MRFHFNFVVCDVMCHTMLKEFLSYLGSSHYRTKMEGRRKKERREKRIRKRKKTKRTKRERKAKGKEREVMR